MTTQKLILIILAVIILTAGATIAIIRFTTGEDTWLCQNDQWIKHGNPSSPMPTSPCGFDAYQPSENSNLNQTLPASENPNVKADFPKPNDELASPAQITGSARYWYFEASFPVKLLDENGKEIAAVPAQAQGDWMTDQFVPFKADLEFIVDKDQNGTLILMNDNPSGLPENEQKIEIPVKLKATETLVVKVFFGNEKKNPGAMDCSLVYPVERKIAKTQTIALASLNELIKGPTEEEKNQGYYSNINTWTTVNKVTIKDSAAYADFANSLEDQVGGSCRVAAIASQIRETLKQFPTVKNVVISINGRTEDILQP
ncbi:MAG: hypothetical protein A2Y67_00150 [Candidatus Buchananbacteria bacterium RBG_13_39_9]|uniref:GerMN domain-containing protein n=1 Tax=Candidatus Buchananbacteria bacterium RBG_13_39_9 TaxID=1797531 RepID=A0A1G1XR60_9BACT|nr:MAG: hypothetical protein A2Y67_00150 [Candidatus Buchananbacteria bacterium RBG_13_39_9]